MVLLSFSYVLIPVSLPFRIFFFLLLRLSKGYSLLDPRLRLSMRIPHGYSSVYSSKNLIIPYFFCPWNFNALLQHHTLKAFMLGFFGLWYSPSVRTVQSYAKLFISGFSVSRWIVFVVKRILFVIIIARLFSLRYLIHWAYTALSVVSDFTFRVSQLSLYTYEITRFLSRGLCQHRIHALTPGGGGEGSIWHDADARTLLWNAKNIVGLGFLPCPLITRAHITRFSFIHTPRPSGSNCYSVKETAGRPDATSNSSSLLLLPLWRCIRRTAVAVTVVRGNGINRGCTSQQCACASDGDRDEFQLRRKARDGNAFCV